MSVSIIACGRVIQRVTKENSERVQKEKDKFEKLKESEDKISEDIQNFTTLDYSDILQKLEEKENMKVLLYTEGEKLFSKSGLGKAIKHQMKALDSVNVPYTTNRKDDYDIVTFIRRNIEIDPEAVQDFINVEKTKGFTAEQLIYVKELLIFISQNGKFERSDLLREELNFNYLKNNMIKCLTK